jgi:NAD+ kinase
MQRIGLVVHPRRELGTALGTLGAWCGAHGAELVQVTPQERRVAPEAAAETCDAIVALGGDGTTLAAIRAAAPAGKPVLGVACGSLGALTAVGADGLADALDRVAAGDWTPRRLPALLVESPGEPPLTGVNDVVVVRDGAGQVAANVKVDEDPFIRFAGDGLVVATELGSSAYTLAAGGPVLAHGAAGFVFTPLAPHGGCCPPLVLGAASTLRIAFEPGFGGARLEVDGRIMDQLEPLDLHELTITRLADHATLVQLDDQESMLAGLRRRRVLIDSPRMLARDDRLTNQNPATGV